MLYFIIYLVIINIVSAAVTVRDKASAERHNRRVRERTLLLLAALGGAPAMFLTMLTIGHKTRKVKFMLGIPLIFIIEASAFYMLRYVFKVI